MSATSNADTVLVTVGLADGGRTDTAVQWRARALDYAAICKPRLSSLVLFTTLVGFFLGSRAGLDLMLLIETLFGTALVAAGASALNQVLECKSDAFMPRTLNRPLPAGRMTAAHVLYFGVSAAITGMLYLAIRVNLDASLWAAATLVFYVFLYTPLKPVTTLNTFIGAIPGALPPLIGWAAARGTLNLQAWSLFAIIFIWQLPHFLAIAWLYRREYARAGLKMLPVVDAEGFSTGRQIAVHAASMLPLALLPTLLGLAGMVYFFTAVILTVGFIGYALNFAFKRTDAAASKLFVASVAYLPLLLAVMMFDSVV